MNGLLHEYIDKCFHNLLMRIIFPTVNIDCSESIFPLCNGDNVEITCLTEAYFEGLLRWTREDDTTLKEYDYSSELGKARMVDNITFTLTKKSNDLKKVSFIRLLDSVMYRKA